MMLIYTLIWIQQQSGIPDSFFLRPAALCFFRRGYPYLSEGVRRSGKRAEQSKKIFRLEEVYETHRDIVYRLKNEIVDYSREEYNKIF